MARQLGLVEVEPKDRGVDAAQNFRAVYHREPGAFLRGRVLAEVIVAKITTELFLMMIGPPILLQRADCFRRF